MDWGRCPQKGCSHTSRTQPTCRSSFSAGHLRPSACASCNWHDKARPSLIAVPYAAAEGRQPSLSLFSPLRRLRDFYAIQLDLVVRWRPGGAAVIRHVAVAFLIAFIGVIVMAEVVPGISVRDPGAGALAVLAFWAFNLLVRPVILAVFAPISSVLPGIAGLVIRLAAVLALQVAGILILGLVVPGVAITGVTTAFIGSWVFAI